MNWDPAVNSTGFGKFCDALTRQSSSAWGPNNAKNLTLGEVVTFPEAGIEFKSDLEANKELLSQTLLTHYSLFNYAKYVKEVGFVMFTSKNY